jgi:hypothetical protein
MQRKFREDHYSYYYIFSAMTDYLLLGGCNLLDFLAPQVGLEPTTLRLTAECSTIELLRSKGAELN